MKTLANQADLSTIRRAHCSRHSERHSPLGARLTGTQMICHLADSFSVPLERERAVTPPPKVPPIPQRPLYK